MGSLIRTLILAMLLTPALPQGHPEALAARATLQVSATVQHWLRFSAVQHRHSYRVEPEDVRRGYVDLADLVTVVMATNSTAPLALRATSLSERRVEMLPGAFLQIAPGEVGREVSRRIAVRVYLPPGSPTGTHPLHLVLEPVLL